MQLLFPIFFLIKSNEFFFVLTIQPYVIPSTVYTIFLPCSRFNRQITSIWISSSSLSICSTLGVCVWIVITCWPTGHFRSFLLFLLQHHHWRHHQIMSLMSAAISFGRRSFRLSKRRKKCVLDKLGTRCSSFALSCERLTMFSCVDDLRDNFLSLLCCSEAH